MYCAAEVDEMFDQWKRQGMSKEQLIVKTGLAEIGWPYVWGAAGVSCTPGNRQAYINRDTCPAEEKEQIKKTCQALSNSSKSCGGCTFYPGNRRTLFDDCQGFVKQLHKRVGIILLGGGCTTMWGNNSNWAEKGTIDKMPRDTVCCVFQWSDKNQNMGHMGEHIGGGDIVECSGTVKRSSIANKHWTHYAIPKGLGGNTPMPTHPTIRKGDSGEDVRYCQQLLMKLGYDLSPYNDDGKFGTRTYNAVKDFQRTHTTSDGQKLAVDGVVGPQTWQALIDAAGGEPTPSRELYTVTIPHLTLQQANALIAEYPAADKKKE